MDERDDQELRELRRSHKRLRFRRRRRRAYIRSVYTLPSLATLGNAVCGFGAIYVAALAPQPEVVGGDPWAIWFAKHRFLVAAYLILLAMLFDALDGRLARFARHTTDFGGQLDSLADVVSFGAAPALIALQLFKFEGPALSLFWTRLIWAIGALYFACAAIRLARFNVSNEHGEQHHFSFLGLPSPGAAGAVIAVVLLHQELNLHTAGGENVFYTWLTYFCVGILPFVVLGSGLMMVSQVRYPHIVNRYLRGRNSIFRLVGIITLVLLLVVAHRYVLGIGMLAYALTGPMSMALSVYRRRVAAP